jgi:hypothetical protein
LINVGSTFEPAIKKVDDADAYVGTTFDKVYSEIFRLVVAEPVTQFLRDRTGQAAIDAWQKRMMAEIERVRKARKTMMGLKKGTKKDALVSSLCWRLLTINLMSSSPPRNIWRSLPSLKFPMP